MFLDPGHIHVSTGITKLGTSIPSVNLPPGTTCDPRAGCYKKCYAHKGRFAFKHTKELLQRNFDIWRENPVGFERDVECAAYTSRFFRFQSSGDIPDNSYFGMMVRVAAKCPQTSFLCFTKKYPIVNNYIDSGGVIPENLHIVFSAWGDYLPDNPYNFPVAYVRFRKQETFIPDDAQQCTGYCGECVQTGRSCWDLKPGQSVVFNEH